MTTSKRNSSTSKLRTGCVAAYQRLLPQIRAVPKRELRPINVSTAKAVTRVLGCLPAIRDLEAQNRGRLRGFTQAKLNRLEECTFALEHTITLARVAVNPDRHVAELAANVQRMRDLLFSNVQTLSLHGLVPAEHLKEVRHSKSHMKMAGDTAFLADVLRQHWSAIAGKTPLVWQDLLDAFQQEHELRMALEQRKRDRRRTPRQLVEHRQAFTLFFDAYAEVRRAVTFLVPNRRDADRIACPLSAGRKRKPKPEPKPKAPERKPEEQPRVVPFSDSIPAIAMPESGNAVAPLVISS